MYHVFMKQKKYKRLTVQLILLHFVHEVLPKILKIDLDSTSSPSAQIYKWWEISKHWKHNLFGNYLNRVLVWLKVTGVFKGQPPVQRDSNLERVREYKSKAYIELFNFIPG